VDIERFYESGISDSPEQLYIQLSHALFTGLALCKEPADSVGAKPFYSARGVGICLKSVVFGQAEHPVIFCPQHAVLISSLHNGQAIPQIVTNGE
jgi:hypothetical protein